MNDLNMNILSIDAWSNADGGWFWNSWYKVGKINKKIFKSLDTHQKIKEWFAENDYIHPYYHKMEIEDDGYNIIVLDKKTGEPLFAIEYGFED